MILPFIEQLRTSLKYSAESGEPVEIDGNIFLHNFLPSSDLIIVIQEESDYSEQDLLNIVADFLSDPTKYGFDGKPANWVIFIGHSGRQILPAQITVTYADQFDREFKGKEYVLRIQRSF